MSDIQIISYTPQPYGASQLGIAQIIYKQKVMLAAKLMMSKAGNQFVAWCSTKVGEQWVSAFELADKDADKRLRDSILAALQPMLAAPAPKQEQEPDPYANYGNDPVPADYTQSNLPF